MVGVRARAPGGRGPVPERRGRVGAGPGWGGALWSGDGSGGSCPAGPDAVPATVVGHRPCLARWRHEDRAPVAGPEPPRPDGHPGSPARPTQQRDREPVVVSAEDHRLAPIATPGDAVRHRRCDWLWTPRSSHIIASESSTEGRGRGSSDLSLKKVKWTSQWCPLAPIL